MKKSSICRHPLTDRSCKFSLEGHCICCNNPDSEIWTYQKHYPLENWVGRTRGKAGIVTVKKRLKDRNGKPITGHIQFALPLCAKHMNQTQKLHKYRNIQLLIVASFLVLSLLLYATAVVLNWSIVKDYSLSFSAKYLFVPLAIFFIVLIVITIVLMITNKFLMKLPYFNHFPLDTNAGGVSGLGFDIKQANQKERGQYVEYEIILSFLRQDAAAAFLEKYPKSKQTTVQEINKKNLNREKTKYTGKF